MIMTTLTVSSADTMRHFFNPLHVYCRLIDAGVKHRHAKRIIAAYDVFYSLINKG